MPKKGTTDEFSLHVYSETTQHVVKNCAGRAMQFSVKPFSLFVLLQIFLCGFVHTTTVFANMDGLCEGVAFCVLTTGTNAAHKKRISTNVCRLLPFAWGVHILYCYEKRVFGQGTFCGNRRYWHECAGATSCTLRLRRQRQ